MTPVQKSQHIFTQKYNKQPELTVYAPGRVNIIGEHTDYNDGFVMPCAINYGTAIAGSKRADHIWNVYAADLDLEDSFSLDEDFPQSEQKWANYVRGVVKFIQERCPQFKQGADLVISGNVPHSSGLSSSAALEVATGKFSQQLSDLPLTHTEIALIGQKAENKFVGANCGNMDQLISALGQKDHLLMIDCRSLETQATPVPKDVAVIIVNSNVPHDLVTGEYNTRRWQCEKAAEFFGVKALRDVSVEEFQKREAELTALNSLVAKRARHVVTENQRVLDAVEALKHNDLTKLGELMGQSHESMRDDFEITVPQIDYLVELAQLVIGKTGGARMTGGGFGGCIVALAPHDKVEEVRKIIADNYEKQTGLKEDFYVCTASQGVSLC
ncbi:MAG: galactokinase [Haemophilus parainfluenzae]|jgi:galactokinase|uniref:galactokinase n=1 Tax=uncultured Haemophilus sp. TaxID=237779 RepID=UPI0028040E53|nr:galactokinase [uncultured Haemophilus sp.]MDU4566221.1 galactokinase [Haemophilus parainfluenzae]MDU4638207.1 galactokinase [Haemophilus parainfluenzae]MDU5009866.1 galactokinase [Haemophilus parainfluenzae]MDU5990858.1 galactokinase [Haemophilus parainfluenzae]MDU7968814.1 galactokinase [Haemophilus parainfluenzae]